MIAVRSGLLSALAAAVLGLCGTALLAHPGAGADWGSPGWGSPGWETGGPGWYDRPPPRAQAPREGRVSVARFRAEGAGAAALGHGAVAVVEAPAGGGITDPRQLAVYEAAVIDALARGGYDTAMAGPAAGQVGEVRLLQAVAEPAQAPHRPVSGTMTMGVSNRGSMLGLGIAIDATRPRGALIATRLETRIRDRASGQVLWEGHAEILTREGEGAWNDNRIAARLADALFRGFPARLGESIETR